MVFYRKLQILQSLPGLISAQFIFQYTQCVRIQSELVSREFYLKTAGFIFLECAFSNFQNHATDKTSSLLQFRQTFGCQYFELPKLEQINGKLQYKRFPKQLRIICNSYPEKSHRRGRITVWLVTSLTRLDLTKEENVLLPICMQ